MIKIEKKIVGMTVGAQPAAAPAIANKQPSPTPGAFPTLQPDDRRLRLGSMPGVAEQHLKMPRRPESEIGFTAWSSNWIQTPFGKMALSISTHQNGHIHPFEAWALGKEQPSGASIICQLLSKVLQTDDQPFIAYHLQALKKAGSARFDVVLPDGNRVVANSVGSMIAHIYEAYAKKQGYLLEVDGPSPMLETMASRKEPKTNGAGGIASYDDVKNVAAGHDFCLFTKEAWSDRGCMPISVWMAGESLPEESDAICKLISLAMRHRDPLWTAMALRTMAKDVATGKELGFANVGNRKPEYFHSTWAYVAALLLHRYEQLGILDADGRPLMQGSLFANADLDVELGAEASVVLSGLTCPECQTTGSMAMQGGCPTCTACSYSKCGG